MKTPGLVPYGQILRLIWPLALGMLNNAVMQFVDRSFLARESMLSLEAALPASVLAWVVLGFFQSLVAYSGVFVARFHGAGDTANLRRAAKAGLFVALPAGLVTVALSFPGMSLLGLVAKTPELAARQCDYFLPVMWGGILVYCHMAFTAYFTGIGHTRRLFWINLCGNAVNIALDPLLIFGWGPIPALSIRGAAYATLISLLLQNLTLLVMARHLFSPMANQAKEAVKAASEGFFRLVGRILRFGMASGGYTALNILSFVIFVFITGRTDDVDFAVSNACLAVNYLLMAPIEGIAIGAQTLVSNQLGKGSIEGAKCAAHRTLTVALATIVILCLGAVILREPILRLYAPTGVAEQTARFMEVGRGLIWMMMAWQIFDVTDVVLGGALKGTGDTRFVFGWMTFCAFGIWLPLVVLVWRYAFTIQTLWLTTIVYVVIVCMGEILRWRSERWRSIKLV